ncbi:hypothetical protein Tco_0619920 [Tanacetum coccineum]|uniref:Uncharacterized protein n=1 Tax=Tanacetum coccineum TaxID=301880 RepID=A0ABQ5DYI8_9ASTR
MSTFHELVLMCPELVSTEKKKIEKYIRGFPEGIKGNVTSSKPATLHDAINMARELLTQGFRLRHVRSVIAIKEMEDNQGTTITSNKTEDKKAAKVQGTSSPGPFLLGMVNCHKHGPPEGGVSTRIPIVGCNSLQKVTFLVSRESWAQQEYCPEVKEPKLRKPKLRY